MTRDVVCCRAAPTMNSDRKTLIADTAIALLGELGARGLTHRAVDARAGLAMGSTSFYCRSRIELLSLALQRHAALDLVDLEADAARWAGAQASRDSFAEGLVARIGDWLSHDKRHRLVARFELFLIASREPELAQVVDGLRTRFLYGTTAALRKLQVPQPEAVAPALMMMVDAMLFAQVGHQAQAFDAAQCRRVVDHILGMGQAQA